MKTQKQILTRFGATLLLLAATAGSVRAADFVAKSFDTDIQEFGGGWDAPKLYTWDGTRDAQTNGASGSLQVDVDFSTGGNSTLQANLNVASYAAYDKVRLSVYLDAANTPNANGHYGSIAVRLRGPTNWDWPGTAIDMGTITNTGWTHFEKPLPVDVVAASQGLNIHWTAGFNDLRTIWVDDLIFVERQTAPLPPTLAIEKAGPGLEIKTTGGPDYARKNVATANELGPTLSWLNSTGPVTYSMTINENVQPTTSPGYAANILLCAGMDLVINASPDWNQPSGIFLEVAQATNGTYDVTVRYKTNAPNSHGIRFTADGLLIEHTNTTLTSLVGTWSLTLSNDTVALSGPGGINGSAVLPADALDWFGPGNNFWALFGAQPYLQNNRIISLSRVKIQGGDGFSSNLDQDFVATGAFGDNLLAMQEGAGGVIVKPTNTVWRVYWGLPDTGMLLWSSPTVNAVDWADAGVTPITQGTQRTAFVPHVTGSAGLFQLRDTGPTLPAIPLESFETAVFSGNNPPYVSIAQSAAAGVTDGTYSMEVLYDNSETWAWMGQNYDATAYANWHSRSKLVFDIHRAPETFGWNLNLAVAINGDMGWNQTEPVAWVWLNAGESATQTITWDYSAIKAGAPAPTGGSSFQLNLMARGSHGGNVYFDNVRFED